jgi:hypothetical protein
LSQDLHKGISKTYKAFAGCSYDKLKILCVGSWFSGSPGFATFVSSGLLMPLQESCMNHPHEASPRFTVSKSHYLLCKRQKQSLQASLNLTTKTQHTSIVKPAKRQFQHDSVLAGMLADVADVPPAPMQLGPLHCHPWRAVAH